MALRDQLENAGPGAVVRFSGAVTGIGKVTGLKGTKDRPVVIEGADPSAVIGSSGVRDVGNLRLEGCSFVVVRNLTLRDSTLDQGRAFQAFGCSKLLLEDLATGPNVRADHFHFVKTTGSTLRRCRGNGAGGAWLRQGVGPHMVYVAEGCSSIICEDGEATGFLGAPLQCNGEDGPVSDVTFRRWRLRDWQNGAALNLPGASAVELEDIDAESHAAGAHGIFASGRSVTIARYRIVAPSGPALSGVQVLSEGAPQPPRFDAATSFPPPAPQPPDQGPAVDWQARALAAEAKLAQVRAIVGPA